MTTALRFDTHRLQADLRELPPALRAVFAVLCARRLAPAYERAGREVRAFAELHARLWHHLTGDRMADAELRAAAERAIALLPDEEGAEPYAEDALAALAYAYGAAASDDAAEAACAARRVYEALDTFLQEQGYDPSVPGGEEALRRHPLVQAELRRQAADVEALRRLATAGRAVDALESLRERADGAAASIFGET